MNNAPQKHHYLPVFYLKRWAGADGQICEFSKPNGVVKPKRVHPAGTGYIKNLYQMPGQAIDREQAFETLFLRPLDGRAATALDRMHSGHGDFTEAEHDAWALFLISLLLRSPEEIKLLKDEIIRDRLEPAPELKALYLESRRTLDPATLEEVMATERPEDAESAAMRIIATMMAEPEVRRFIRGMTFSVVDTATAQFELLTSDRPYVLTNGLAKPGSYLLLPIGPRKLFAATIDEATQENLKQLSANELVRDMNRTVAGQAAKYVYGSTDKQLRFVENRMSKLKNTVVH